MTYEVYYVGDLSYARRHDPRVDEVAERFLIKGTTKDRRVRDARGAPLGTGDGFLTQRKLEPGVYEYRYTPRKGQRQTGPNSRSAY